MGYLASGLEAAIVCRADTSAVAQESQNVSEEKLDPHSPKSA